MTCRVYKLRIGEDRNGSCGEMVRCAFVDPVLLKSVLYV